MKISELPNAPEWLVLANAKNADVSYDSFGRVIWNGGEFRGGEFLGGEFLGGTMLPSCKWDYGTQSDGRIKIGCKVKTEAEWNAFFDSHETYSTERGTDQFKRIQACFEATKAFNAFMNKDK